MQSKIYPPAPKTDAFHLKSEYLFGTRLHAQLDFATSPYDPLPREPVARLCAQKLRHRAMMARKSCGRRDLPVRSHFSFRNGKDNPPES